MRRQHGHRFVTLLLILGAAAGCGQQEQPEAVASGAPSAAARAPGDHRLTTSVAGAERAYLLHAPPGYDGSTPMPLVIALHHRPGTPETMRAMSRLDAKADEKGFLVAYPQGVGNQFKAFACCGVQDDVGFVKAVATQLVGEWKADPERVFLAGASNGAELTFRAAVEATGVFAAVAPVSGGFVGNLPDKPDYAPASAVSMVTFIGAADPMAQAFTTGVAAWRDRLSCRAGAPERQAGGAVTKTSATCADGSDVEVYLVRDAGHVWFGAPDGELADPKPVIDATDVMWDFFAAHPRRR